MKRGSAIIIAIFLVSAVGSIAFSIGRITRLGSATSSAVEKGIGAYYAAESGIEEAFLRYRHSQASSLPFNFGNQGSNLTVRNSLSSVATLSDASLGIDISDGALIDSSKQIYDLQIQPKSDRLGDTSAIVNGGVGASRIPRDEAKKFRADFSSGKDLKLYMRPVNNNVAPTFSAANQYQCVLLEIKILGQNLGESSLSEHKKMLYNPDVNCNTIWGVSFEDAVGLESRWPYTLASGYAELDIKDTIMPTLNIKEAELFIKPIGADIDIALESTANEAIFASTTEIVSNGYYAGTSRRLTASIDQQSGTLYDLFDYVIYVAE